MRNLKPLLQINKFSGAGQNGILYCEGFYPEVDNGKSVMSEGFTVSSLFNYTTTGFSGLTTNSIYGSVPLSTIKSQDNVYSLYIDNSVFQSIYANQVSGSEIKDGIIHSSTSYCRYPDIIETALGNILYPYEKTIGRGVRGKVTGGSTTTLIDTTRNFTTLGYAANDKVTNLKTGIEYTITSISTTTSTNDTLNFTANGTNTNTADDEFIAWEDDRFSTDTTKAAWQLNQMDWVKQFKIYANEIFFTNGNYIGAISSSDRTLPNDESTVVKDRKQLPAKYQAVAIGVNTSKILVSANFNGKGALLLWDYASDGWNNILKFDKPILALTEYQSGWVFISDGYVYYTDGYQIQRLYSLNQNRLIGGTSINPASHNGLVINNGILYCASAYSDLNLVGTGVYAIDLNNVNNGFTVIKQWRTTKTNGVPYSIFVNNRFSNSQTIEVGGYGFVNYLGYGYSGTTYYDKSLIISIPLDEQRKINGIGLNLSRYLKSYDNANTNSDSRVIQVSIGDGNRALMGNAQTATLGTPVTTFMVNGTIWINNEIGDEIFVRDTDEATYGERTFITDISMKGTNTETWTTSPALSTTHTDSTDIKMIRVNLLDKKTVSHNGLKDEIMFFRPDKSLMTNKLFIEIVMFGNSNALPLNINEINVYGE